MKILFTLMACVFASNLYAQTAPEVSTSKVSTPEVNTEVQQLLGQLERSGCQFNRNGTWYDSAEAKTHLQRKLDYLNRKGTLKNTEQFIELAGSKSSSSGKPYQVKCSDGHAVTSASWLTKALQALRTQAQSQ